MDITTLKNAHTCIKEWPYQVTPLHRGYTNKTLYINLTTNEIREKPVTQLMKDKFIGGKGFGLKMLWEGTRPDTKWNDPDNEIIISPGPCSGITQYAGAGKSLVVSISPLTDIVIDSNVGGFFGPFLKFSGYDALEIQGKAAKEVIIIIDGKNGVVRIEEAPLEAIDSHVVAEQLTEMYADDEKDRFNISVISAGIGADNSLIGLLNFSFYDKRRKKVRLKQAGRGGIGTVFRDKNIKAIVAKVTGVKGDANNVADMPAIVERGKIIAKEIHENDASQCRMKSCGTAHLVECMNDYDLLPVHNFKFGNHPEIKKIDSYAWTARFTQGMPDGCWIGCTMSCAKAVDNFIVKTGPYKGHSVIVDGPEYETVASCGSNPGIFDQDFIIEANFYCDTYGVDTISIGTMWGFVMECWEKGILNKERTGGLELTWGNKDAAMELLHQMARGEGFGKIFGQGVRKMKDYFVKEYGADRKFLDDIGMENKGLEYSQYLSKESLAQQGGYALTNKGPQHDEAWLIFMDMVNNRLPTFENKAEALHYFPMFRTWFGLMGFCKLPWNDVEPTDNHKHAEPNKVPDHVESYLIIYKAVTGKPIDIDEMIRQSERVYNYQRIFNIRRGYGLRQHDNQPYRACGPVTVEEYESRAERYDKQLKELVNIDPTNMTTEQKMAALRAYREDRYSQLMDAVYARRGWTKNGVPTVEHLTQLGMDLPELFEVVKPMLAKEAVAV